MKTNNYTMFKALLLTVLSLTLLQSLSYGQSSDSNTKARMTIEDFEPEEYGEGRSIGFGIFHGFGLIGRTRVGSSQDQLGLEIAFRTLSEFDSEEEEFVFTSSLFLTPEYNFYLGHTYKEKVKRSKVKQKYRKHFLSAKVGTGLADNTLVYSGAITWHRQTYDPTNKTYARGFDLGLEYLGGNGVVSNQTSLFFRVDWGWYR